MTDLEQLQDNVYQLSIKRAELNALKEEIDKLHIEYLSEKELALSRLRGDYEVLRDQVLFEMQVNKLETLKNDKVTVSITHKPTFILEDEGEALAWLEDNGFELTEFMVLDSNRIKTTAEARLKETGEIIPGTRHEIKEIINVRDKK